RRKSWFMTLGFLRPTATTEIYTLSLHDALPILVSAGANQNIVLPQNSVNLNGTVIDDGFPSGGTLSQFWSMVTGPGKITFANPKDRKSTRLNSSHLVSSYAVFCLKKKNDITLHA